MVRVGGQPELGPELRVAERAACVEFDVAVAVVVVAVVVAVAAGPVEWR